VNRRHHGSEEREVLKVARIIERTEVLGPGVRADVSVQGCLLNCRGCHSPAARSLDGGVRISVASLAERLSELPIDGVTYSGGGEPMLQARALSELSDALRRHRPDLSLMSYSGYRYEALVRHGSDAQRELLERLDLLVDGPYVRRLHAKLRWRGSTNQRLIPLSSRHLRDLSPDDSVGVELAVDEDLRLSWVGVPEHPGFVEALEHFADGQLPKTADNPHGGNTR
jgi:anaerobic ribonucleoside-triphosphate reductase activating protein